MRFQIKPHIFFLFQLTVFIENFDKKSVDFTFLGVSKIETQRWYSLKPGVFDWGRGLRPLPQSKPLVSMKPPLVSIFEPPKTWNHKFLVKVSLEPSFRKKKWGFLLKPWLVSMKPIKWFQVSQENYLFSKIQHYIEQKFDQCGRILQR